MSVELSEAEKRRYARHLILPEVGEDGQKKLRSASVCVVGAGGLGSPVLMYLTAAGVGRIGIVDDDVVEESNLQRQVIHSSSQIGISKVASAVARLESLNPNIAIEPHITRLDISNAFDILGGYDIVVDGTDNLPTRYLISDACEIIGIPWVYGSIYRFEGHLSLFNFQNGPNYRDLFPTPPPSEMVPSCAEGGVLGVLPAVIGSLQANEVVKTILGIGDSISGILLVYDALETRFRGLQISRDPNRQAVTELSDVEEFCASNSSKSSSEQVDGLDEEGDETMFSEITPTEVAEKMKQGWQPFVLDVRSTAESEIAKLERVDALIPHNSIDQALELLPAEGDIVVHCHHGGRSMMAITMLIGLGIDGSRLYNLAGGINAWSLEVDSSVPRY